LPHLADVVIEHIDQTSNGVAISASARADAGACPRCGHASARVHSRYQRSLADAAISGQAVEIRLRVRRFFCDQPDCAAKTFAEQVPGVASRYARRTPLLTRMLEKVGLALAGRAGARLASALGLLVGRATMLRIVRALPDPEIRTVTRLGVDDFAIRRGRVYGSVLIDIDTHRPVDLLPDREAASLAQWLREHPGVEVICRDRAGAYAEGARAGAPQAIQVADRWHLWHNLAEHAEKTVAQHRGCLQEHAIAAPETETETETAAAPDLPGLAADAAAERVEEQALVKRTRERYAAVQELLAQGKGIKPIMRELGLAKETVRRFARAGSVDALLAKARDGKPSILDEHKPYLHQRWNDGCTTVQTLFNEIKARGYRGSYGTVREYLRPFRALGTAPAPTPAPPKVRDVTKWMLSRPETLDTDEKAKLSAVLARCAHLEAAAGHVATFADMLTGLHGERLDEWIAAVETDDLPELHSFTNGLKRDRAAVVNGLTLPYSSGPVEGAVNRIKAVKRQMYGRAKFDLLRKRILLPA
jgi:transposase